MSEPSNTPLQGLLPSLNASGKSPAGKSGLKQDADSQSARSFSSELDQALEKQSSVATVKTDKAVARVAGEGAGAPGRAGPVAEVQEAGSQDVQAATEGSQELLATRIPAGRTGITLPLADAESDAVTGQLPAGAAAIPIDADLGEVPTMQRRAGHSADSDVLPEQMVENDLLVSRPQADEGTGLTPEAEGAAVDAAAADGAAVDPARVNTDEVSRLLSGQEAPAAVDVTARSASADPVTVRNDTEDVIAEDAAKTEQRIASSIAAGTEATADKVATVGQAATVGTTTTVSSTATAGAASVPGTTAPAGTAATVNTAATTVTTGTAATTGTTATASAEPVTIATAARPDASFVPSASTVTIEQLNGEVRLGGGQQSSLPITTDEVLQSPATSDARIKTSLPPESRMRADAGGGTVSLLASDGTLSGQAEAVNSVRSVALVQPTEVGEVISQAALAARYRFTTTEAGTRASASVSGEADTLLPGSAGSVDGKSALTSQPVSSTGANGNSLTAGGGSESGSTPLPAAVMAPEDSEPVLRHADLLKELQTQRAALSDSLALPGSSASADTLVKSASADNMFLPLTGGIVTAPVLQRTDAGTAAPVSAPFNLPLLAEDADAALASNVKWMAKEGIQNATVTVSPAGMGPISVKVGIDQDQMSVSIVASQHTTREALDAMLPRLREQLATQGHESVKVDVSDGRGEQSKGGNGQMFAGMRNQSDSWTQGDRSNSGGSGNQTEYGDSNGSTVDADRHMAEDLQRVALRTAGGTQAPSAFDAYV